MSLLLAAGSGGSGNSGEISVSLAGAIAALEGAQTFSGAISSTLSGASASLSGSVTAASVSGSIGATLEGASAAITSTSGVQGGGYDYPKKRFIVEKNGKLLVFSNANAAVNAIPESSQDEPVQVEKPKEIPVAEVKKVLEVSRVDYLLTMKHLEALVAEYEAQRDEQEIEELLLLI